MSIYFKQEFVKQNLWQRIFRTTPKQNALIEINNLLAVHEGNLIKIDLNDVLNIADKYDIELNSKNKQFRLNLFEKYLKACLADEHFDESEIASLKHLREILLLTETDSQVLLVKESEKVYTKRVEIVVGSFYDDQEKSNLEKIRSNLQLPERLAEKIYEKTATAYVTKFFNGITSDERLTPEEDEEFNELTKRLGVNPKYDDKTASTLDLFRLYWRIENGELPILFSDLSLGKSEILHFKTAVDWLEYRRVPKRVNYGGPTARIRLAKGIYYRVGSIGYQNVSEDEMQIIDSGIIYLTNKRLIFTGSKGNKTIPLNKILGYKPYTNGVDIQKDAGKSPFLQFEKNIELFTLMLCRLLYD